MHTEEKVPLANFLQLLSSNGVPMSKALAIAGKVYKEHNTPAALAGLTDATLLLKGVDSKHDRKLVLAALWKAGYTSKGAPRKMSPLLSTPKPSISTGTHAVESNSTHRKRKRSNFSEEYLPDGPPDSELLTASVSFDFNEIFDEETLKTKCVVINRAPVMMAWAMVVAEHMHFLKEEALSIASVYTEMNAISKGVSLGIYDKGNFRNTDAQPGGSQPYVELMGRRPLYCTQTGQWRALNNGNPVAPLEPFSYIARSFRQTAPHFVGALRLLANSYSPQELNVKAWNLYAEFRPQVNEWGKQSEVQCKTILGLRKQISEHNQEEFESVPANTPAEAGSSISCSEPNPKKPRSLTVEEYEALLDQDTTFDNIDLDL
ncbi:hypothetical protein BDN70DRAFT_903119 [Pholiota conissans]|uniref:Uncharacterized protein n=1 Tax=Pholiota conissans TaxID=109636 RepID=A0A9P5ZC06_9AGAR|nr:hypothetical protein BDN70DRAFT_903119 [Pholiota conissans]